MVDGVVLYGCRVEGHTKRLVSAFGLPLATVRGSET